LSHGAGAGKPLPPHTASGGSHKQIAWERRIGLQILGTALPNGISVTKSPAGKHNFEKKNRDIVIDSNLKFLPNQNDRPVRREILHDMNKIDNGGCCSHVGDFSCSPGDASCHCTWLPIADDTYRWPTNAHFLQDGAANEQMHCFHIFIHVRRVSLQYEEIFLSLLHCHSRRFDHDLLV
jgi:hypothetical protein